MRIFYQSIWFICIFFWVKSQNLTQKVWDSQTGQGVYYIKETNCTVCLPETITLNNNVQNFHQFDEFSYVIINITIKFPINQQCGNNSGQSITDNLVVTEYGTMNPNSISNLGKYEGYLMFDNSSINIAHNNCRYIIQK